MHVIGSQEQKTCNSVMAEVRCCLCLQLLLDNEVGRVVTLVGQAVEVHQHCAGALWALRNPPAATPCDLTEESSESEEQTP